MMEAQVLKIERVMEISAFSLPDGRYKGTWGGYQVSVKIADIEYTMTTDVGIRTPFAPCTVMIENGTTTIEL